MLHEEDTEHRTRQRDRFASGPGGLDPGPAGSQDLSLLSQTATSIGGSTAPCAQGSSCDRDFKLTLSRKLLSPSCGPAAQSPPCAGPDVATLGLVWTLKFLPLFFPFFPPPALFTTRSIPRLFPVTLRSAGPRHRHTLDSIMAVGRLAFLGNQSAPVRKPRRRPTQFPCHTPQSRAGLRLQPSKLGSS